MLPVSLDCSFLISPSVVSRLATVSLDCPFLIAPSVVSRLFTVSLDCPFLIAPLVFSYVSFTTNILRKRRNFDEVFVILLIRYTKRKNVQMVLKFK